MVKSLRALRLSLPGLSIAGGGERIILDIFFLAISEFYRQNYDVMRMHLKMIRHLVPLLGEFSSLCQYVRSERDPLPSDIEWACTRNRAYLSLSRPDEHSSIQQRRTYCVATTLLIFCYECTYVSAVRSGKLVLARLEHFLRLTPGDFNQIEYNWGKQVATMWGSYQCLQGVLRC
jgi:hypothetical protein